MTQNANILVVEDNDFVRMQIAQFLTSEGYSVAEGKNGKDAVGMVADGFDLAIVDVRMEPIDGFEFLKNIRSRNIDVGVVMVTGDQNPDLLSEAARLNVGAVLIKPVQKERLVKTVERILSKKAKRVD